MLSVFRTELGGSNSIELGETCLHDHHLMENVVVGRSE